MRRLALLPLLVLLAACGGSGGGGVGDDASGLVPGNAIAYLTVDTDFSSSQLKSAQDVLDKFPARARVLAAVRQGLSAAGVDPKALKRSAGPQVDVAVLNLNGSYGYVAFAQPSDEQSFEKQLAAGGHPQVHTTISGWTVFADEQRFVDAVKKRQDDLADRGTYKAAVATLPEDAVARAYISPAAIHQGISMSGVGTALPLNAKGTQWAAAALTSSSGAVKLEVHAKGLADQAVQKTSKLAEQIPSGAIVALSFVGGRQALGGGQQQALEQAKSLTGIDFAGLAGALGGEAIAYVRAGLPIPEVTIATKPKDVQQSLRAVGSLIRQLGGGGKTSSVTVDGVVLKKVDLGSIAIFYGAFDGELVVSDSQNAVSELKSKSDKLADDSVYRDAKDAAGLPDSGEGFVFVNLKDGVPAAEGLAQLANQTIPKELEDNLKPLRSLLVYGSHEGGVQSFVALLQTS